jgi:ABC-type bacteriocin/lantibiotic exporter with double-glycine peptidase domain
VRAYGVILIGILAMVSFTACARGNFADLQPGLEERGHYISNVPFYRQEENSCGPAALASVASFWGQRVNLEQIRASVYVAKLRGTLPMDMERFMREAGFKTTSSAGTLDELKATISGNVPAICLLDLGLGLYRRPHYVTVVGFDDVKRVIIAHDGLTANKVIGYEKFIKAWGRAGNWMLIAQPGTPQAQDKR